MARDGDALGIEPLDKERGVAHQGSFRLQIHQAGHKQTLKKIFVTMLPPEGTPQALLLLNYAPTINSLHSLSSQRQDLEIITFYPIFPQPLPLTPVPLPALANPLLL